MINSVRVDKTTWGELPHKFEAGTSPIAEAYGLGLAIDYLEAIGLDAIETYEHELAAYALGRLGEVPGIKLYGPPAHRRAGSCRSTWKGSTRTTSPRSSTCRESRSVPGITAASR